MCLYIEENQQPEIAIEDITCYKVILENFDRYCINTNKLYTYYQKAKIIIGGTYKSKFTINSLGEIERGLHSFTTLEIAEKFISVRLLICKSHIVKCIIPKGSKYYLGRFYVDNDSYASNRLKYVEIVETYE